MAGIGSEDLQSGTPWWGGKGCEVGSKISGTVISAGREQQRDFDTGAFLEWDNGDPRMESVVVLQTDLRDPSRENDDGRRALHLRGGNYEVAEGSGQAGEKALLEAINKTGIRVDAGVKLTAAITGMAKATGRGRNPAKLWSFKLEPAPAAPSGIGAEDDDDIFG